LRAFGGSLVPDALLIDDNAIQLRVRETVLRDAGFSAARASSVEEASSVRSPRR
jgi:CheY-like chemotaxis protein